MNILHAKSPCCGEKTIHYGGRRRQCSECGGTWRIRKKKRGRKSIRPSFSLVRAYLDRSIPSLYATARKSKYRSEDQLNRRLTHSLKKFVHTEAWPDIPLAEPLIAIADAMIITIDHLTVTFYFILARPRSSNQAIILAPYCKAGSESYQGWQEAFALLAPNVRSSIRALVSDGHGGLISVARQHRWITQRCNFHIIAKIQGRRSRWGRSRHQKVGQQLYELLHTALTRRDEETVQSALRGLRAVGFTTGSTQLKTYISGFIKHYQEYRSYLIYPELCLPRTSNTAETLIGSVRRLCNRAHGFRTIHSLTLWIHALLKHRRTVTCNGFSPTELTR